jgi:hypothetical protein
MLPEMGFLFLAECAVFVTECTPIISCLNPEIVTECVLLDRFYGTDPLHHGWLGLIFINILISHDF